MNREGFGGWPVPAPVNHRATMYARIGVATARRYTVSVSNGLGGAVEYEGTSLADALTMLVEVEEKGWRGSLTETVTYRALTRPNDWFGHRHACGCIELPEVDRTDREAVADAVMMELAIDSTDHGPGFARTCDHGRELWRAAATAMPGIGDVTAEVWSAAHDVHFAAWYAHLDPRGEA
jgi:hypothetical protein